MNRDVIDHYSAGAAVLADAIAGLTAADLDAVPIPGTWSIRQIVAHLMDSDVIASDRMKRTIAEDSPTLMNYDENAFAAKLGYDTIDAVMACEVFRLNRVLTAVILKGLPDDAFARIGLHSERGPMTLETIVTTYVAHLAGHMTHLRRKRELLGKPLA